ncbi:MAG: phosphodiester glycosidase family protein [Clostridiales bacterium]|jgi:exopolysaccharide biosynthesis protein|nr:phosphodiester glycosidase family protein [Clostridiales bacterium]
MPKSEVKSLFIAPLKRFFSRPYSWATAFSIILAGLFSFILLDSFVIPRTFAEISGEAAPLESVVETERERKDETSSPEITDDPLKYGESNESDPGDVFEAASEEHEDSPVIIEPYATDSYYEDENIKIEIETYRVHDTTVYAADIQLASAQYFKTAMAQNAFGRNLKQTTSEQAAEHNAILAINGDYYGFRDYGWVLRNGQLYRNSSSENDVLTVSPEGNFKTHPGNSDPSLLEGMWQAFSFGPALIESGEILVGERTEVSGRHSASNPRTAMGQIEPLHYVFIVSNGRTENDDGLSLLELAEEFASKGCHTAYNLDGGGSAAMIFNGNIQNTPTTNGKRIQEREVSDIVYIGY